MADFEDLGKSHLQQHGFKQYEVSAYARNEDFCQHNLNYWQFGDYLGIGCGAHGKISDIKNNQIIRTVKVKHPKGYLDKNRPHLDKINQVKTEELPFEYMMNQLRLHSSFTLEQYQSLTGLPATTVLPILQQAQDKGLVLQQNNTWQVSQLGHRYLNDLLTMFL